MRVIRFKSDCIEWIKKGIKITTFRRTRKSGVYEIAMGGSWYHPKRTGLFIQLTPIQKLHRSAVILDHYLTEGDFRSPMEFTEWLKRNELKLPEEGWLHAIEYLGKMEASRE